MIYLLLSVFCSVLIANMIRWSGLKNLRTLPVMCSNYILAAVFSLAIFLYLPHHQTQGNEWLFGAFSSLLFVYGFFCYFQSVKMAGITIAVSAMRLSVAVPVICGFFMFSEPLTAYRITGLILMSAAVFKLGRLTGMKLGMKSSLMLAALFLIIGTSDVVSKVFTQSGGNRYLYLTAVFGFAFLLTLIHIKAAGMSISPAEIRFGLLLGLPNQASSLFLLLALRTVDSVVAFPTTGLGILAGSVLSDVLIWKEPLTKDKIFTLLLAGPAIWLLNM
ncbi:MAG: EamA family transporter [Candidatus Wallbacteria bacterium]|nr:EamA family transporter [Candidatus Wallbacteria bacterium]